MTKTEEILPLVKEVVKAYQTGMEWKLLKEVAESEENFPYHPESTIGQIEKWIESVETEIAIVNSPIYDPYLQTK